MKFANLAGRLHVVRGTSTLDVGKASGGQLPADPTEAYARWADVTKWASAQRDEAFTSTLDPDELYAPSPAPPQVFVLGLNYRSHAEELGWGVPDVPMVFTKFPSSVTGPGAEVEITGPKVDWEVELVVVIGKGGHHIAAADAWDAVAGFTVGQDVSDRDVQIRPQDNPQHGLGKSFKGFSPIGPVLATMDEVGDPHDLGLRCWVNGELVQDGRTDDFVFPIPFLIEYLSNVVTLLPGDLIFTGTPSGVGIGRKPPRFLSPGDEVRSEIDGIGEMVTKFVPRP
ncbi:MULTISPECIES: fumarylacetoacetate hydrolase family protein [unclassified Streptomyces]|jgi:2-keto-4-pentenoate hydratase/2-oxohepta-3-ene-1,7-dioic acid hydratase in catechol pathway|uniref:fumarylacetoacetate hydrolase family protein n=1 Tax=unclassified Streptomyces TaxID=2593676 RepID=UPI000851E409|nr:fumarylacetoacetate hydrolase family protein [Streptomyces sp. LUP47B]